jgi:Tfp pilus assembly protein PilF
LPVAPVPVETTVAARKPALAKSRAPVAPSADPPASAALMVEAMRERRAGNLARARELSTEYRVRYPRGELQEEALALSIEAAAALGDDEAKRLSITYLQSYPRGRFRAQAQRVIDASH